MVFLAVELGKIGLGWEGWKVEGGMFLMLYGCLTELPTKLQNCFAFEVNSCTVYRSMFRRNLEHYLVIFGLHITLKRAFFCWNMLAHSEKLTLADSYQTQPGACFVRISVVFGCSANSNPVALSIAFSSVLVCHIFVHQQQYSINPENFHKKKAGC